ncbi:PadR family transcriptional regulator [Atopobium fossor]|uniref:PadR family transcriptional regulator n=1 Tax=Atopobium fossor TaxID=39487 RepID=UPI0004101AD9|nr:PadR family transcriptional regulator [Atopobium fossor]
MDSQMKRGFIEACILAAVCDKESYGYAIIKDIPSALELTESTLYPVLKRLEQAQLVASRSAEHNGRLRKYFHATPEGKLRLKQFTQERQQAIELYNYVENRLHQNNSDV